ncbi:alpha-tocopherol transfer protein-like [Glandiceps talaboti]
MTTHRSLRVTHSCVHCTHTAYINVTLGKDKILKNIANPYELRRRVTVEEAMRDLDGDPENRQQKLHELREMFKSRPDINFRKDGTFLLRFLRSRNFEVNRTFKTVVYYYEVRRYYREIFENYKPSSVRNFSEYNSVMVCPGKDRSGRKVILVKIGNAHQEHCSILDQVRASLMMIETMMTEREIQLNGVALIVDCGELAFRNITMLGPQMLKKVVDVCVNAMPMTVKTVHVVRQPGVCGSIFTFIKPFLTKDVSSMIYLHGDEYGTLHDHVPSAILPSDLGGQLPGLDNTEWINRTLAAEEEFHHNEQFGFVNSRTVGASGANTDNTTLMK